MSPHVTRSGDAEVQYTSYRYEHQEFASDFTDQTGAGVGEVHYETEALAERGGLENDEIAELVALWATISFTDDGELISPIITDMTADFGLNLSELERVGEQDAVSGTLVTNTAEFDDDAADSTLQLQTVVEPGVLWHVHLDPQGGIKDTGNNTISQGSTVLWQTHRAYRELLGRGPIVDPTDSLDAWVQVGVNGLNHEPHVKIRQTLVWDVSTVDARRAEFSLP